MAVVKSGIVLVAENYAQYMSQLDAIQKKQAETFSGKGVSTPKIPPFPKEPAQEASKLSGIMKSLIGDVGDLGGFLTGLISKFALVTVAIKLASDVMSFFSSSLQVAQRNETLGVSLAEVGKQAGYTAEQIAYAEQKLKVTGITTQAARQSLLQMAQANISFADSSKLARIAQGAAVIGHTNSSDAFERMITGIQRGEVEILKTIGLNVNFENSYKKLKAQMGVKELNEQEKMQARMNAVLEAGIPIQGVYTAALDTSGKQQASMARYVEESQAAFGKLLLPLEEVNVEMQTKMWKGIGQVTTALSALAPVIETTLGLFEELQYRSSLPADVGKTYDEVTRKFIELGMASDQASGAAKTYIEKLKEGKSSKDIYDTLVKQFIEMGIGEGEAAKNAALLTGDLEKVAGSAKKIENTDLSFLKNFGLVGILFALVDQIEGVELSFTQMAKGILSWFRIAAESGTIYITAISAARDATLKMGKDISDVWGNLGKGDFEAAGKAIIRVNEGIGANFKTIFEDRIAGNLAAVKEKFPDLYKSLEELQAGAEDVDLTPKGGNKLKGTPPDIDAITEALKKQKEQLEATKDAFKKFEDIQNNYQKDVLKAEKEKDKALLEEDKKYAKERENLLKKQALEMQKWEEDNAIKRMQMIRDFNDEQINKQKEFDLKQKQTRQEFDLKQKQDKKKFYDDQKKALKDFQLSQMQDARSFALTDRRMQAEGDVVALMQAREDFALHQQEKLENFNNEKDTEKQSFEERSQLAKEQFDLQEKQAKESFEQQTKFQQEEFAKRLSDFDANLALERERKVASDEQDLADLDAKHEEEKAKILQNYEDKLAALTEAKAAELEELGKSLADEQVLTQEGMDAIAKTLGEVYDEEGIADLLIKGFGERSTSAMGEIMASLSAQIDALEEKMKNAKDNITGMGNGTPSTFTTGGTGSRNYSHPSHPTRDPVYMRQGGMGVVTGPRVFEVEAGQREAVMFAPLPSIGRSNLNVNMSGGFQIRGAQAAGKAATEAALDQMVLEFSEAILRLGRK